MTCNLIRIKTYFYVNFFTFVPKLGDQMVMKIFEYVSPYNFKDYLHAI